MSASKDQARSIAFNPHAPEAERRDALAELHKSNMPTGGDVLAPDVLAGIMEAARWGGAAHAGMPPGLDGSGNLLKAIADHPVPRPGPWQGQPGMQSVRMDERHQQMQGEYWEKPASMSFRALRAMVEQAPILNAVVLTRIRQIQRFCGIQEDVNGIGFTVRHIDKNHTVTDGERESMAMLTRFVQNCGWEFNPRKRKKLHRDNFPTLMGKLVRDSLTMDSCAIETEFKRDRRLGLDGLAVVDGETIRLTALDGYRGDTDIFAVQVIDGTVRTAYTYDDLIYEPRNPRSDVMLAGYGMAETELLVRTVTGFLNAMTYNIDGFSKNAIPKGVLHLSGDYSQDDLISFRRYWNSMVKGASSQWSVPVLVSRDQESKASFEKFGVDFDEMAFSKWITFLASLTCAIYGMSPSEINFDSFTGGATSALSGSDTAEKLAESKDKGLRPLLSYFEGLISDYVISEFSDRYVFRWTGLDGDDAQERKERARLVLTVNEVRTQEGYDKIDGPLGDAPLNPSLIGPWLQMTQQQGGEGGEGGDFDGEEQGGQVQDGQQPGEESEGGSGGDFGQDGAAQGGPAEGDFGQEQGQDRGEDNRPGYDAQADDDPSDTPKKTDSLRKANPYRDERHGIALGDEVFCRCPKQGAVAGKVQAFGKDGFTLHCEGQGTPARMVWGSYLGHKTRAAQAYTLLHEGEDGALVEDPATGKRRYITHAPALGAQGQDVDEQGKQDNEGNEDEDEADDFDAEDTPITKSIRLGTWR